jgi:fatty acid desaturase
LTLSKLLSKVRSNDDEGDYSFWKKTYFVLSSYVFISFLLVLLIVVVVVVVFLLLLYLFSFIECVSRFPFRNSRISVESSS